MNPFCPSHKKDLTFVGVIVLIIAACLVMPDLFNSPYSREEERYVGTVQTVDDSHIQRYGIVKAGSQQLTVRLDEGPYKGREIA
ncbi:MAG TPA: hypothetical protein DDY32_07625, partial [Desulfobulbaceae bacterium]|nr:hypothetical protein [Desulfobulbaceae bacterium]